MSAVSKKSHAADLARSIVAAAAVATAGAVLAEEFSARADTVTAPHAPQTQWVNNAEGALGSTRM